MYVQLQSKINTYLQELHTDGKYITYAQFLQELHKSHEQYILALDTNSKKYKLFLKKNVKDIHINMYVKDLVVVWEANHDISYVLDAYSSVMYILIT